MVIRQLGADFDEFVVDSSPRLLALAYRLTGDRHAAEDMVQTCLWRMAKRWPAARNSPVAYARQVLANLAKDGWRNRSRRPPEILARSTTLDGVGAIRIPRPASAAADQGQLEGLTATGQVTVRAALYWAD